jgi:5'-methylthioadenosine phosphorylase
MMLGIIGGSGLDKMEIFSSRREVQISTPFGAPSDAFILGTIGTTSCAVLARHSRSHTISPTNINYRANIYAFKKLGCTHIIATTACGSLSEPYAPQHLCTPDSFIDLTKKRHQTFYDGTNPQNSFKGILHIPMGTPYCEFLRAAIGKSADSLGLIMHKSGTIVTVEGPRFGSKAESKMIKGFGGDLVNMTGCPEVVLAGEAGLCYASIGMITDYDCWRDGKEEHADVGMIMGNMRVNGANVIKLLESVILGLDGVGWVEESKGIRWKMATENFLGR